MTCWSGIIEHQQPLDGIPDNDHLDSSDEDLSTNGQYSKETSSSSFGKYSIYHYESSFILVYSKDHNIFLVLIVFFFFFPEKMNMNRLEESVHSECAPS